MQLVRLVKASDTSELTKLIKKSWNWHDNNAKEQKRG